VSTYNVHASVEPGKTVTVKFKADKEGVYPYYCTEFCSALHLEMQGYLLVKPKGWKPTKTTLRQAELHRSRLQGTLKKVADTQAVIDSVVGYITSVNYKDFPDVVAMVEDATDQLGKTKDAKAKHEAAPPRRTGSRPTCGPSRSGNTRSRRPTSVCVPRPTSSRTAPRRSSKQSLDLT
jgi:nitrous-oxide reductase